mgnify:CR=1 FL=1
MFQANFEESPNNNKVVLRTAPASIAVKKKSNMVKIAFKEVDGIGIKYLEMKYYYTLIQYCISKEKKKKSLFKLLR